MVSQLPHNLDKRLRKALVKSLQEKASLKDWPPQFLTTEQGKRLAESITMVREKTLEFMRKHVTFSSELEFEEFLLQTMIALSSDPEYADQQTLIETMLEGVHDHCQTLLSLQHEQDDDEFNEKLGFGKSYHERIRSVIRQEITSLYRQDSVMGRVAAAVFQDYFRQYPVTFRSKDDVSDYFSTAIRFLSEKSGTDKIKIWEGILKKALSVDVSTPVRQKKPALTKAPEMPVVSPVSEEVQKQRRRSKMSIRNITKSTRNAIDGLNFERVSRKIIPSLLCSEIARIVDRNGRPLPEGFRLIVDDALNDFQSIRSEADVDKFIKFLFTKRFDGSRFGIQGISHFIQQAIRRTVENEAHDLTSVSQLNGSEKKMDVGLSVNPLSAPLSASSNTGKFPATIDSSVLRPDVLQKIAGGCIRSFLGSNNLWKLQEGIPFDTEDIHYIRSLHLQAAQLPFFHDRDQVLAYLQKWRLPSEEKEKLDPRLRTFAELAVEHVLTHIDRAIHRQMERNTVEARNSMKDAHSISDSTPIDLTRSPQNEEIPDANVEPTRENKQEIMLSDKEEISSNRRYLTPLATMVKQCFSPVPSKDQLLQLGLVEDLEISIDFTESDSSEKSLKVQEAIRPIFDLQGKGSKEALQHIHQSFMTFEVYMQSVFLQARNKGIFRERVERARATNGQAYEPLRVIDIERAFINYLLKAVELIVTFTPGKYTKKITQDFVESSVLEIFDALFPGSLRKAEFVQIARTTSAENISIPMILSRGAFRKYLESFYENCTDKVIRVLREVDLVSYALLLGAENKKTRFSFNEFRRAASRMPLSLIKTNISDTERSKLSSPILPKQKKILTIRSDEESVAMRGDFSRIDLGSEKPKISMRESFKGAKNIPLGAKALQGDIVLAENFELFTVPDISKLSPERQILGRRMYEEVILILCEGIKKIIHPEVIEFPGKHEKVFQSALMICSDMSLLSLLNSDLEPDDENFVRRFWKEFRDDILPISIEVFLDGHASLKLPNE